MKQKLTQSLRIMLFFMKIGCFTFGGGWSIVAQIQNEFVEKRHWITEEELLDFTSVARSLPGIMIANTSFLFGHHIAGPLGGIAALVGITLPSVAILSVLTLFYDKLRDNLYVARALVGVRAAVLPIIGAAAVKLRKGAFSDWVGYALAAVTALLSLFTAVSNALIVAMGAAAGFLILAAKERKQDGTP